MFALSLECVGIYTLEITDLPLGVYSFKAVASYGGKVYSYYKQQGQNTTIEFTVTES